MAATAFNLIARPAAVGGLPLVDAYNRVVTTLWGPSTTDYGFSALAIRCDDDGTDENANGGLIVAHSTGYTATAGYGHVFQVYAAGGMEGLILGSNTANSYIRFEVGPLWPDSEVGRIRGVSANAADWIFNWNELRTVTASQSGTTITATSGTFTSADVGRWACWNEYQSGKTESNAYRITAYTDSTHVTVDTSKTIPSQSCRISIPRVHIGTLGNITANGPSLNSDRFVYTGYGTTGTTGFAATVLSTKQDFSKYCGMYIYDTLYTSDAGLHGCTQIASFTSDGLVITSAEDTGDIRIEIGYPYPASAIGLLKKRSDNGADWFFNWNMVRTHTASQSGTTVTATVGTFVASDKGRYIMWAGVAGSAADFKVYRITAYTSATQVTVDTNVAAGITSQSMRVCSPKAIIDSSGAFKSTVPTGAADPTADNFEAGTGGLWKNTTAGETRYWFNDAGTLKKSAAFT